MDLCHSYHNCGRAYGHIQDPVGGEYMIRANNLRMTEYQAAIGIAQLKRLDEHTNLRNKNAAYLKSKISQIPGIVPYKLYENVTRASFHFFPFRYLKEEFSNLTRDQFLKALNAEGVPAFAGYKGLLFSMPYLNDAFQSKNYQLMYPKKMLDFNRFVEQNQCPESKLLSNETGVWMSQNLLLGTQSDMDDIYKALEKIHANSAKIKAGM